MIVKKMDSEWNGIDDDVTTNQVRMILDFLHYMPYEYIKNQRKSYVEVMELFSKKKDYVKYNAITALLFCGNYILRSRKTVLYHSESAALHSVE